MQNPEKLYREPLLMSSFLATVIVMSLLLFVRIPRLEQFFLPTLPQVTPATPAVPSQRPAATIHLHSTGVQT